MVNPINKKLFCILLSSLFCFLFITGNNVYATFCDKIIELAITPKSGDTAETFLIRGKINNCINLSNAPSVSLFAENPNGDKNNPVSISVSTNASGEIVPPITVKFPNSGIWNFFIINTTINTRLVPPEAVTATVTQGRALQCGEECSTQSSGCPSSCTCQQFGTKWFCGGTSIADPSLAARCNGTITPQDMGPCTYATREPPFRCGTNGKGFVCQNEKGQLCVTGAQVEANVLCQIPPTAAAGSAGPSGKGTGAFCKEHLNDTDYIDTAIGCIQVNDFGQLVYSISRLATGIGGGIALLLMISGAFRMITSAGNPDAVKAGQEQFSSAIIGLLFVIFAVLLLKVIGVDILNIPGFG